MESSGEKRVLEEYNEIQSKPSDDFECRMLGHNPLEWVFAVRGCRGTEFKLGIYHGLLRFSKCYPLEPPSVMLLTKNGRFKIKTKIGLNWQPAWRVREALLELICFMDTDPDGKLGSVKSSKEKRRTLAIQARAGAPEYGTDEHQKLIDENHKNMLSKAHPLPVPAQPSPVREHSQNDGAKRKQGTSGGCVGNNNVVGNIFLSNNSNAVGFLDSMNMNEAFNEGPKRKKPKLSWFWW